MTDRRLTFESGELFANRYEFTRELGAGGMGKVYLVKDRMLGEEELALKVLLPELSADDKHTKRFLREVQLTRKVTHQNVVRTYDVGQEGELLYFTLEYVDGKPLTDFIVNDALGSYETALIMLQICRGLAAIHEQGIIHRDLKPANILLTRNGVVKIADFGIARPNVSQLTGYEEVVGSAPYMAPEIWRGTDIGPSADIYALGAMAYELLTGAWPFDGETAAQVMCKHLEEAPVAPYVMKGNIPVWLGQLVTQMMAKDPEERPEMDEIGAELVKYLPELRQEWHAAGGKMGAKGTGEIYISSLISGTEIPMWEDNYSELEAPQYAPEPKPIERQRYTAPAPAIEESLHSGALSAGMLDVLVSLVQFCILGTAACIIFWLAANPVANLMSVILRNTGHNSNALKFVGALLGPLLLAATVLALPYLTLINRKNDLSINLQTYGRMILGLFIFGGFVFVTNIGLQIAGMDSIGQRSGFSFSRPAEQAFSALCRVATFSPTGVWDKKLSAQTIVDHGLLLFFASIYFVNLITVVRRDILLIKPLGRKREMLIAAGMTILFSIEYLYVVMQTSTESLEVFRLANFSFSIQKSAVFFMVLNWAVFVTSIYYSLSVLQRNRVNMHTDSLLITPR